MARYELIGKTLAHSFSKPIHEALGAYKYSLCELPGEDDLRQYIAARNFSGCNVTIPYKQAVIPLLDKLDERAKRIGAVNTIVNNSGVLTGYNTDYDGFSYMLARKNISVERRTVLLLGSGGTHKTATAVLQDLGAKEIVTASRTPQEGRLGYPQAAKRQDIEIIVNVSPSGMFPHNGTSLVQLSAFKGLAAVADVVYNPLKTRMLLEAEQLGLPFAGGLPMLVEQAVAAARLFTGLSFGASDTERILQKMTHDMANLVLVGMPSCGKSKLGEAAAKVLQRPFIDLDCEVEKQAGKSIPQIFEEGGEEAFRQLETEVLRKETMRGGRVIATGGGVVTKAQNLPLLRQNGVVVFIDRPLQNLLLGNGRPLSKNPQALAEMEEQRRPLYEAAADIHIDNTGEFSDTVQSIVAAFTASLAAW